MNPALAWAGLSVVLLGAAGVSMRAASGRGAVFAMMAAGLAVFGVSALVISPMLALATAALAAGAVPMLTLLGPDTLHAKRAPKSFAVPALAGLAVLALLAAILPRTVEPPLEAGAPGSVWLALAAALAAFAFSQTAETETVEGRVGAAWLRLTLPTIAAFAAALALAPSLGPYRGLAGGAVLLCALLQARALLGVDTVAAALPEFVRRAALALGLSGGALGLTLQGLAGSMLAELGAFLLLATAGARLATSRLAST